MRIGLVCGALILLGSCKAEPVARWLEPITGMELLYVAPHTFRMGSTEELPGREPDETLHEVTLSTGFYLGRFEVTQGQWQRVMGANPSAFQDCGSDCPVENVTFREVQEFLRTLSSRSAGPSRFRLPTEAEWEAACRAGSATAYSTGSTLTSVRANFDGRYPAPGSPAGPFLGRPAPVGSYAPNTWGFHDLSGNVWEWCEDWYGPYPPGEARDPTGPATGTKRVIRGGSWVFDGNSARCGLRYTHAEVDRGYSIGFRVVRELLPLRQHQLPGPAAIGGGSQHVGRVVDLEIGDHGAER